MLAGGWSCARIHGAGHHRGERGRTLSLRCRRDGGCRDGLDRLQCVALVTSVGRRGQVLARDGSAKYTANPRFSPRLAVTLTNASAKAATYNIGPQR